MISAEAGGWREAAILPYDEAFRWATKIVRQQKIEAHRFATLAWASSLGLYCMGGTIPDPPEPPE